MWRRNPPLPGIANTGLCKTSSACVHTPHPPVYSQCFPFPMLSMFGLGKPCAFCISQSFQVNPQPFFIPFFSSLGTCSSCLSAKEFSSVMQGVMSQLVHLVAPCDQRFKMLTTTFTSSFWHRDASYLSFWHCTHPCLEKSLGLYLADRLNLLTWSWQMLVSAY